jgi:hypothetical protein
MTVRETARSVFVCAAEAEAGADGGGGARLGIDGRRDEELMEGRRDRLKCERKTRR